MMKKKVKPARRQFLKTASAALVLTGCGSLREFVKPLSTSESMVVQLYNSLDEGQKKKVCFPYNHVLRQKVDNNWFIVKSKIGKTFNKDQQDLIQKIFLSLHSEEYQKRVLHQVNYDNRGKEGSNNCAIALFGTPGTGQFEFVYTGRHVTRRCAEDSAKGKAFGGPIFYGHDAQDDFYEDKNHEGNIYWYQHKSVNKVFSALDGKQRKKALLLGAPKEQRSETVAFKNSGFAGLSGKDMSRDQKALVTSTLKDMLAMFRKEDVEESLKLVQKAGGIDNTHLSFYGGESDIGKDNVWDVWKLEGPNMVWYFRGHPHVHAWLHIKA